MSQVFGRRAAMLGGGYNPVGLAAIMAAIFADKHSQPMIPVSRFKGVRSRYKSNNKPHQGENEKARRRRQIAKGMLTASNGLR